MNVMHLCETCHYVIQAYQYIIAVCSKIVYISNSAFSQYFSHTEVLIIKVYRKKVLLIPPNPSCTRTERQPMVARSQLLP